METSAKADTRKKIRVRKNIGEYKWNYDDEYHIPLAAQDSKWSGISLTTQRYDNIEHACGSTEDECEIKLIDLESSGSTSPLLILFPDLRNEESLEHLPAMSENLSTSSLTKLLRGKKAKMELLKSCKKLNKNKPLTQLETVKEDSSGTGSLMEKKK